MLEPTSSCGRLDKGFKIRVVPFVVRLMTLWSSGPTLGLAGGTTSKIRIVGIFALQRDSHLPGSREELEDVPETKSVGKTPRSGKSMNRRSIERIPIKIFC